jgi:hypothetical protein
MTLARAHAEIHKLVAQQGACVLGMLAQVRLRKLLELAGLLKKMIDTHLDPVLCGINASIVVANFWTVCDVDHASSVGCA